MKMKEILLYMSVRYDGSVDDIMDALDRRDTPSEDLMDKIKAAVKSNYITVIDDDYPNQMKVIPNPPAVLYTYGNVKLLNEPNIEIAGTVNPSQEGILATERIVKEAVDNGMTIIAELTDGVCETALRTAISYGGNVVAFIANGIEKVPSLRLKDLYDEIKANHLLVSEYALYLDGSVIRTLAAKRIITGFADNIVVTESIQGEDTVINMRYGVEYDKTIYCIPHSVNNHVSWNNELIKNGAEIYTGIKDLKGI